MVEKTIYSVLYVERVKRRMLVEEHMKSIQNVRDFLSLCTTQKRLGIIEIAIRDMHDQAGRKLYDFKTNQSGGPGTVGEWWREKKGCRMKHLSS